MSILDLVLLALLILGLVRGFINGLFVELASIVALIAGIYGAFNFSNYAASYFKDKVDWEENTINVVALVATFMAIVLLISLTGKVLTKIADFAMLGLFNKVLGAAFGGFKAVLILSVVLIIVDKMNADLVFIKEKDKEQSVLYKPVKSIVPSLFPHIIVNGKPIGDDVIEDDMNDSNLE